MNRIFHSEMAVTVRAGGACTQLKTNIRANNVFRLHIWPSIRSRAINGFNECVLGFYTHRKVWYKSEKAFDMCSEWHYTTRGLAYGDMTTRPMGSLSKVSIRQSPSLCNAILNTCPCFLAIFPLLLWDIRCNSCDYSFRNAYYIYMYIYMHIQLFIQFFYKYLYDGIFVISHTILRITLKAFDMCSEYFCDLTHYLANNLLA